MIFGSDSLSSTAMFWRTLRIFFRLFELEFPIHRMRPIIDYKGNDFVSVEANNTSAFNCRRSTGRGAVWSRYSYGRAFDLNPIQNPYMFRGG